TIVTIGPWTNLARLAGRRRAGLAGVPVVVMGGWVQAPGAGLPPWSPERDSNVRWDTRAAEVVARAADRLTLVTVAATLRAPLRRVDLPRLRRSGPLGTMLAHQSELHARRTRRGDLGRAHPGLPDDLVNLH